jgi:hypothetical protein
MLYSAVRACLRDSIMFMVSCIGLVVHRLRTANVVETCICVWFELKKSCVRRLIVGVYMDYLTTLLVAQITQGQKVVCPVNNDLKGKW